MSLSTKIADKIERNIEVLPMPAANLELCDQQLVYLILNIPLAVPWTGLVI